MYSPGNDAEGDVMLGIVAMNESMRREGALSGAISEQNRYSYRRGTKHQFKPLLLRAGPLVATSTQELFLTL